MSKSQIDRNDALNIASKIGASVDKDGAHQLATLRVDGNIILTFGIRHGSKSGHGHLCGSNRDLRMNEGRVVALARCTMSKEQYFDVLREKGVLPPKKTADEEDGKKKAKKK